MTNSMTFHSQIASVMEVLANAAVAQICKLVDDDYAVFRLEMTQSQRENRVLRRKLQTLEVKMARERAERTMRERVLANRLSGTAGGQILDKFRGAAARGEGYLPGRHRSFGIPGDVAEREGPWGPGDQPVASSEGADPSTQGVITVTILDEFSEGKPGGSVSSQSQLKQERSPPPPPPPPPPGRQGTDRQSEELEDTGVEVCLVKEERKDGEEEEEGMVSRHLDSALMTGGELSDAASVEDWTMETSPRTWTRVPQEPLLLHHEPDPGPGSEPDRQGTGFSLAEHGHWTGGPSLSSLGPISMVPHIWTQRRPAADSGSGVGSGPSARPDLGSGVGSGPSSRPDLGSGVGSGPGARPALGSGVGSGPGARPDLGSAPRPSLNHPPPPPPPPHSYLPTLHGLRTHPQHQRSQAAYSTLLYPPNTLTAGSKTHQNSGAAAVVGPSGGGALGPLQPGRADGRGKADSERPYSCPTCGKRFTEASYVKKHQTVHTREKPFRCKQCWKSFSFLSNLIRHRGVHRVNKDQEGSVDWTT